MLSKKKKAKEKKEKRRGKPGAIWNPVSSVRINIMDATTAVCGRAWNGPVE